MNRNNKGNREADYLGVILRLSSEKGEARVGDIAEELGVKSPSVTEMLKRLDAKGLINYEKYRRLELTERGRTIAGTIEARHHDLEAFLTILRVSKGEVNRDAHSMEQGLSLETMGQLSKFVRFIDLCPNDWKRQFKFFSDNGECP
ncbi:MAG: metal-dependent transcriptional regulator [Methanomassiliicoccales archaeon]